MLCRHDMCTVLHLGLLVVLGNCIAGAVILIIPTYLRRGSRRSYSLIVTGVSFCIVLLHQDFKADSTEAAETVTPIGGYVLKNVMKV